MHVVLAPRRAEGPVAPGGKETLRLRSANDHPERAGRRAIWVWPARSRFPRRIEDFFLQSRAAAFCRPPRFSAGFRAARRLGERSLARVQGSKAKAPCRGGGPLPPVRKAKPMIESPPSIEGELRGLASCTAHHLHDLSEALPSIDSPSRSWEGRPRRAWQLACCRRKGCIP